MGMMGIIIFIVNKQIVDFEDILIDHSFVSSKHKCRAYISYHEKKEKFDVFVKNDEDGFFQKQSGFESIDSAKNFIHRCVI